MSRADGNGEDRDSRSMSLIALAGSHILALCPLRREMQSVAKESLPNPTRAELAILQVLWRRGPCTVREVHEELSQQKPMRYTTPLKLMQIMAGKGLLRRDEAQRAHVYEPAVPEQRALQQLTLDLMRRAFGGSAERLVLHALQTRRVSAEGLARIRERLDEEMESRTDE